MMKVRFRAIPFEGTAEHIGQGIWDVIIYLDGEVVFNGNIDSVYTEFGIVEKIEEKIRTFDSGYEKMPYDKLSKEQFKDYLSNFAIGKFRQEYIGCV